MRKAGIVLSAVAALVTVSPNPLAHSLPTQCQQQPWGFLGTQTRQICDGPILSDGSWMRRRIIGYQSYYRNETESCSGGSYYSTCTFYPAGVVPERDVEDTTYPVRPETVLGDEPGHLG